MTVLSPTSLETTDYGQQGWNAIHSANMEKLNAFLVKLWGPATAPNALGALTVSDAPAQTAQALTDNTSGTAGQTLETVSGSGADQTINNNFASLADEMEKLRADNAQLRMTLNNLLSALRKTGGCGVLNG